MMAQAQDATVVTVERLAGVLADWPSDRRCKVALAGPPGAGKSYLADAIQTALLGMGRRVAILPMDGYHYDDAVLAQRGMLARKGAPETFDVAGFRHMLARLARNEEAEVAVPVFDRSLEIARAGARLIPQEVEILIVEGNYLLLNQSPWDALRDQFDVTVQIDAPEGLLRKRLTERWIAEGLSPGEITQKVEDNDLPNCRLVQAQSYAATYRVQA